MGVRLVVVGASWGGLRALNILLEGLPASFGPPVAIVQHRRPTRHASLAGALAKHCALPVVEPTDKEAIEPGRVYVAPADYHLLVGDGRFVLSIDEPTTFSRPSIDELFESAAAGYGAGVVGVLLTGASEDGANGLREIRRRGGIGIVQDPTTAERSTMPEAGIAAGGAHTVLPLDQIAPFLTELAPANA